MGELTRWCGAIVAMTQSDSGVGALWPCGEATCSLRTGPPPGTLDVALLTATSLVE